MTSLNPVWYSWCSFFCPWIWAFPFAGWPIFCKGVPCVRLMESPKFSLDIYSRKMHDICRNVKFTRAASVRFLFRAKICMILDNNVRLTGESSPLLWRGIPQWLSKRCNVYSSITKWIPSVYQTFHDTGTFSLIAYDRNNISVSLNEVQISNQIVVLLK